LSLSRRKEGRREKKEGRKERKKAFPGRRRVLKRVLRHWPSTLARRTAKGYAKASDVDQNETQEPLEA
jgi:hypothetical protein